MKLKHNWPLLAGLRGFLALVVLACHLGQNGRAPAFAKPLIEFGASTAVVAFLFISGYSICHSITTSPKGFYERRVNRIYPVFFACFLLAVVPYCIDAMHPERAFNIPPDSAKDLFLNAFPVQTILVHQLGTNPASWSLGVECFFYALAPWFLRCQPKALWILAGVSVLFHSAAAWWGIPFYYDAVSPLVPVALFWAWIGGWLIYQHRESVWLQRLGIGAACAAYALNPTATEKFIYITLAGSVAILLFQTDIKLSPRVADAATYAGELSYPLYLCHLPVVRITQSMFSEPPSDVIVTSLCIMTAMILYHCVELPYRNRNRNRLVASSKQLA